LNLVASEQRYAARFKLRGADNAERQYNTRTAMAFYRARERRIAHKGASCRMKVP